jgi:hypothetical protein
VIELKRTKKQGGYKMAIQKPISEIGHKWKYNRDFAPDYIVIDVHNSNFHPGTTAKDSPKFCKIMTRTDGREYIRHAGTTWIIDAE